MNRLKLVTFLIITVLLGTHGAFQNRILGGSKADVALNTHQVGLFFKDGFFFCGGSLITPKCILTAAHCVHDTKVPSLEVRAGFSKRSDSDNSVKRNVHQAFVPQDYNDDTVHMDVAILKLSDPMDGKGIKPIELARSPVPIGIDLRITGWGRTSNEGRPSDVLQQAFVQAMSRQDCTSLPRKYSPDEITNTMFCAVSPKGDQDTCKYDSGGPVVANGKQFGIVSWGNGCGDPKYPGVYTDIAAVLPWINTIVPIHC